jgi:hypothetical protein
MRPFSGDRRTDMRRTYLALVLVLGCGGGPEKSGGSAGAGGGGAAGGAFGGLKLDAGGAGAGGSGGSSFAGGSGGVGGSAGGFGGSDAAVADAQAGGDSAGPGSPDTSQASPDAAWMGAMGDTAAPPPDSMVIADATATSPDAALVPADMAPPPPPVDAAPPVEPDASPPTPDSAPPTPDIALAMPDASPPACTSGTPLGCPAGSFCSLATHTCLPESGTLHFTFSDSCALAGAQADVKLFDETNGGGWPAEGIIYVIPYGMTKNIDIACIPGATICFGAEDHATGTIYWGTGLSNNHVCTSCCVTCGPLTNVQPQNLLCN